MILYFTPGGRLGNQLFQYAFLTRVARPREVCITTRMEQLQEVIEPRLRIWNVRAGLFYSLLDRLILPLLVRPLCRVGLLGLVAENRSGGLNERRGLIPGVRVVEGYFQRESFVPPGLRSRLELREPLMRRARQIVAGLPAGTTRVFVHVRRTDLKDFPVRGVPDPRLPLAYYERLLDRVNREIARPFFIFLTDDPDWVDRTFAGIHDRLVSRQTPGVDLALMTLCDTAILSNSSLSWWGAFLMRDGSTRYCPKYWLGWKSRAWHPDGIRPSFAVAVEVPL